MYCGRLGVQCLAADMIPDVLQKRPSTPTTKRYVVDYMRVHTRSFAYTLEVLHNLERQAREEIERLGGNPQLSAILDSLSVHK